MRNEDLPEERDLAHEADMERLRREQLRGEDFDGDELMGDPDEYDEHYCVCQAEHGPEELDTNQCDCCGRAIE